MAKIAKSWSGGKYLRLSERERKKLLRDILAEAVDPNDIWIFCFGSLMWKPGFQPRQAGGIVDPDGQRRFLSLYQGLWGRLPVHGFGKALADSRFPGRAYQAPQATMTSAAGGCHLDYV